MKPTSISAEALFEEHRAALHWEWVAGHAHPERRFDEAAVRSAIWCGGQRTLRLYRPTVVFLTMATLVAPISF